MHYPLSYRVPPLILNQQFKMQKFVNAALIQSIRQYRVLLGMLRGGHLVKKFRLYSTWRMMTVFRQSLHMTFPERH
jgi:hypothetical protein